MPTWPPPKSAQRRKNVEAGIRHRWCPPPSPSFLSEHKKKRQDQDRRRPPNHGLARRDLRVFLPNQSPDHSRTEQNKHGRTSEATEERRSEQRKSPGSRIKRQESIFSRKKHSMRKTLGLNADEVLHCRSRVDDTELPGAVLFYSTYVIPILRPELTDLLLPTAPGSKNESRHELNHVSARRRNKTSHPQTTPTARTTARA